MSDIQSKTFGAVLLITGTAIGAGMLGLPVSTGASGLAASICVTISCYFYMLATIFLFLEAMYYSPNASTNLTGLCRRLSGRIAESITWLLFLSLLYIASAAYMVGSGEILSGSFAILANHQTFAMFLFSGFFGSIAFFKMHWVDYLNRLLIYGLVIAFAALIFTSCPHIKLNNFSGGTPYLAIYSIPIVITSFTSHLILPSIRAYLDNNLAQLKKSILIGCTIPLLFYIIWEFLILGLLPHSGEYSLTSILNSGQDELKLMIEYLSFHYELSHFSKIVSIFSFFAISTSFWGVMISLRDFIDDGLDLKKYNQHQAIAVVLSFLPPICMALFLPAGFTSFLKFAGLIILLLYGFLPIYLVWRARYTLNVVSAYTLPGGKTSLIILFIITFGIFVSTGIRVL
jgi:tyrosine-specific transport protein